MIENNLLIKLLLPKLSVPNFKKVNFYILFNELKHF